MKKRHQEVADGFKKLNSTLNNKRDDYLEQISNIINKAVKKYNNKNLWKKSYDEIVDLIYKALTETYLETVIALKEIYQEISDEIPNLEDFIYKDDNKTLSERVKDYWNEAASMLKASSVDTQKISLYLLNMYDRILTTEIQNVKQGVKKVKKPINMGCVEVIIITDGECCEHGGIYLASDDVEEPPYHPNCQCDSWTDYYDPDDEQDLEVLKELGWEEADE